MTAEQQRTLNAFLASLVDVPWFSHAGQPDAVAIVAEDLVVAWDDWNADMIGAWSPASHHLESSAVAVLGEDGVDQIFETVSSALADVLREGISHYFEHRPDNTENAITATDLSLWPEWLQSAKRDLCWAGVEAVLGQPGFFTDLIPYYRAGRWPCARVGGTAQGRIVVL